MFCAFGGGSHGGGICGSLGTVVPGVAPREGRAAHASQAELKGTELR